MRKMCVSLTPSVCRVREVDRRTWDEVWPRVRNANLMQSWQYGEAKAQAEGYRVVHFIFEDRSNQVIAIAQILTKTWGFLGGIARLNRGPQILVDAQKDRLVKVTNDVLTELKVVAKQRRWWLFLIAPELSDSEIAHAELETLGFRVRSRTASWGSAKISLASDDQELLSSFRGKWRNLLKKSLKADIEFLDITNFDDKLVDSLIASYHEVHQSKSFVGVPQSVLRALAAQTGPNWIFSLHIAKERDAKGVENGWIGFVVSIIHGDTATYFIAGSTEQGRKSNVNYALIWRAILSAKAEGCQWFDLGGLTQNTPAGIAHFKKGLSGEPYRLIGEFYSIPSLDRTL